MRFISFIVFAGVAGCATASAQNQSNLVPVSTSTAQIWNGNITVVGATPYGSGRYPNLQLALVELMNAQDILTGANPPVKSDYLPRAIKGVQLAISDVKGAIDNKDGVTMPPGASLPTLPEGLGNANSTDMAVPTTNLVVPSPSLHSGMDFLANAVPALKATAPGDKGIFLPRAIADVAFAIDNLNAAINLSNGQPATQPKPPGMMPVSTPAPVSEPAPAAGFEWKDMIGPVLLLGVLVVFGAVQAVRHRSQG